jgi:hypothetical protein
MSYKDKVDKFYVVLNLVGDQLLRFPSTKEINYMDMSKYSDVWAECKFNISLDDFIKKINEVHKGSDDVSVKMGIRQMREAADRVNELSKKYPL